MPSSRELCLLSLDGGGVRGHSTLFILKRILETINPEDPPKPCDYFHMICGTSTGGLIALMLGRMRLSIDECIEAYNEMSPHVFTKLHHRIKLSNGETQGRFDHEAIETGVKSMLVKYGFDAEELLKDSHTVGSCKTFVCATSQQTGQPVVLSSYYNERRGTDMYKITKVWEAARATSAATTFFEPITIGDETFIDGATGANNPIQYLWTEAGDVLGDPHGRLEDDIKCIVSIGTGIPSLQPFGPSLKEVAGALKAIATDTEVEADTFRKHHTKLFTSNKAFRFNVLRGLEDVGLEEIKKLGDIKAATRGYVQMEEVHVQIKACAMNLQEREWLKTMRRKGLNLISPAVTSLNDEETHPTMEELQWLTHTKAYEKWKQAGSGIIWYRSPGEYSNESRKGVAAAVAYGISKQYKCFAGLEFGVGEKMVRALYFQCDRREAGDDYDSDAPEFVNPGDVLWSLIFQCLLIECETVLAVNRRILELDEFSRGALHDSIEGRRAQPLVFLFSVLLQVLQSIDAPVMLALDNIHMLQESTASNFINALRVFVEKQVPQAGRKVPTLITGNTASKFDEQLTGVPIVSDETEHEECIESLYFPEWNARRDQVANAEKGTNDWIWDNEEYQRWEAVSAAVLWIEGKPGSGKSVLAKSLQQRLGRSLARKGTGISTSSGPKSNKLAVIRSKVASAPLVADWFFSTRMGEVGMAHLSLLRSVLYQLLNEDKSFFEFVAPSYRKKSLVSDEKQIIWKSTEINHVLERISKSGTSIVCIIDAMDEAKADVGSSISKAGALRTGTILKILWNLVSGVKGSKIKFIVLSRPDPLIEVDFNKIRKTFPGTYKIVLEQENQGDIETLIDRGLVTLREAIRTYDSESESDDGYILSRGLRKHKGLASARHALSRSERTALENIRLYLQNHAEGVILWVTLVLGELEDVAYNGMLSLPELEERMKALPRELYALYEHVARDLQQRSNESEIAGARSALMLISGAAFIGRLLRVREMWEALAIPDDAAKALASVEDPIVGNRIRIQSWAGFRRQLRRRCGPFIEIVSAGDFTPANGPEGGAQGDIGPDDIVQFMHRTVKDFLLNPERAGLLYFSEEMAAQHITLTAEKYLQIAFPGNETQYGPRLRYWDEKYWLKIIAECDNYMKMNIQRHIESYAKNFKKERLSEYKSYRGVNKNIDRHIETYANKYMDGKLSEYVKYRKEEIAEYVREYIGRHTETYANKYMEGRLFKYVQDKEDMIAEYVEECVDRHRATYAHKYMEGRLSEYVKCREENIAEYVKYVEEKILLQFSLSTLSKSSPWFLPELGYLSHADRVFQINFPLKKRLDNIIWNMATSVMYSVRRFYPELNTKNQALSERDNAEAIAVGEFFHYACSNGLLVATRNLLEICKTSSKDAALHIYTMKNGALLAAIQLNLVSEVRALTKGYRHQSKLLSTKGGWPIGREARENTLDPFIQLAVRSGSPDVVDYLFQHTDRFYARNAAVREFAVTQNGIDDNPSPQAWDDGGSDLSSIRSFDLVELGLVDSVDTRSDAHATSAPRGMRTYRDYDEYKDNFRPTRAHSRERSVSPFRYSLRGRKEYERKYRQREYEKLRLTCIQHARQVRKSSESAEPSPSHQMDDVKESLRLVIDTWGTETIETNPYPIFDNKDFARSGDSIRSQEMHLQEDAFRRFVDRNVMTKLPGQETPPREQRRKPEVERNYTPLRSWMPGPAGLFDEPFDEAFDEPLEKDRPTNQHYPKENLKRNDAGFRANMRKFTKKWFGPGGSGG